MPAQQAWAFLLFAFAAAATPGPSNVLVMAAGARAGVLGGLRRLAGVFVDPQRDIVFAHKVNFEGRPGRDVNAQQFVHLLARVLDAQSR